MTKERSPVALFILAFVLAVLPAAGCKPRNAETASEQNHSQPAVPVAIEEVGTDTLRRTHTVTGTLTAPHRAKVFNEVEGRIVAMPFVEGDGVRSGEILVKLDDEVLRAELAKAAAQRRQAEVDVTRLETLFRHKGTSEDEVAKARTALALTRAEEKLKRTLLSRTVITAPFDGVISERLQEPGDVVPRNTHLLTLIDPTVLTVRTQVSELLLPRLSPGDSVQVRIDALGERRFEGRILRLFPVVDAESLQGTVEVGLSPPPKGALPGQLARVRFAFDEGRGLLAPLAAVRRDQQGTYVYLIDATDTARRTPVHTGRQFGNHIEILEGLSDGDEVVVSGLIKLRDGRKVRLIRDPDADAPSPRT